MRKTNQKNIPLFMENTLTPIDEGIVTEYIGDDRWAGAATPDRYTCDLFEIRNIHDGNPIVGKPGLDNGKPTGEE